MKWLAVVSLLVAACGPAAPGKNPAELWLALNGSELHVQLVPLEPDPF